MGIRMGLGVSLDKTEVVFFTRKYKPPSIGSLRLHGKELGLRDEALFLGLVLDRKLSWKSNAIDRFRKAPIALFTCNRGLSKKWGL